MNWNRVRLGALCGDVLKWLVIHCLLSNLKNAQGFFPVRGCVRGRVGWQGRVDWPDRLLWRAPHYFASGETPLTWQKMPNPQRLRKIFILFQRSNSSELKRLKLENFLRPEIFQCENAKCSFSKAFNSDVYSYLPIINNETSNQGCKSYFPFPFFWKENWKGKVDFSKKVKRNLTRLYTRLVLASGNSLFDQVVLNSWKFQSR